MIKDRKLKKILKFVILIIALLLLIFCGILIYKQFWINKFMKLLKENDSNNYELVQSDGQNSTTIKVYNKISTTETSDTFLWINEDENTRIIMDKVNKSAIITENPEETLEVGSLNSTYITKYFENDDMKFKYLGEENGFYKLQFTNKNTGNITVFYMNKDTNIIEKILEDFNGLQSTYEIKVTLNNITEIDVEYPNLEEYEIGISSSSIIN